MTARIWLSFDLGVRGEYERLFAWLDDKHAKECGSTTAYIQYSYKKNFVEELKAELVEVIGNSPRARIYVIHSVGKDEGAKGQWLVRGRKAAPWAGFGAGSQQEIDQ